MHNSKHLQTLCSNLQLQLLQWKSTMNWQWSCKPMLILSSFPCQQLCSSASSSSTADSVEHLQRKSCLRLWIESFCERRPAPPHPTPPNMQYEGLKPFRPFCIPTTNQMLEIHPYLLPRCCQTIHVDDNCSVHATIKQSQKWGGQDWMNMSGGFLCLCIKEEALQPGHNPWQEKR